MKTALMFFMLYFCLSISLIYAQTKDPILRISGEQHTGFIHSLSTVSTGKYILTCSEDKTARLWNSTTGQLLRIFRGPVDKGNEGLLLSCTLSPDGKIAAIGGISKSGEASHQDIFLFNTSDGKMIQRIEGLKGELVDLEFSPDGKFLAAAFGNYQGIKIFTNPLGFNKPAGLKQFKIIAETALLCNDLCFDRSGRLAAVFYDLFSRDSYLKLYDKNFKLVSEKGSFRPDEPSCIAFSPDGKMLAMAFYDRPLIYVFETNPLNILFTPNMEGIIGEGMYLGQVCFTTDGKSLLAGGTYGLNKNDHLVRQIRCWENSGNGKYTDFDAGQDLITGLRPTQTGYSSISAGFIYSGPEPYIARMTDNGKQIFYKGRSFLNFKSKPLPDLKIASNGLEVQVTPFNSKPLCFSVLSRTLKSGTLANKNFKVPVYKNAVITVTSWQDSIPKINGRVIDFYKLMNVISRSVDITDSLVVFGLDFEIRCTDQFGGAKWIIPTYSTVYSVNITQDKKQVVACLADGTIRWYRMSDGYLLGSLLIGSDQTEWVLFSPNGYYLCSENGDQLFGWHLNNGPSKEASFYHARNYADRYFRPDMVPELLVNNLTDFEWISKQKEVISSVKKLPPMVRILEPRTNRETKESLIQINMEIVDQGGGIDEIRVFNNGKLIHSETFSQKPAPSAGRMNKSILVNLVQGENRLKLTAFNANRSESDPTEIIVNYKEEESIKPISDLFMLIIGINEYKNPRYKLNYAVTDAMGFKDIMDKGAHGIFDSIEVKFIKNNEVTRSSILEAFNEFKLKIKKEDVFIFYYAGHGVMSADSNSQFYIIPYDVTQLYAKNSEIQRSAISGAEIQSFSKELKALKQIFIFDACQSGGIVNQIVSRGAVEERAIAMLARSTGTYWLTASGSEQYASEFEVLGHGLFTYTILQGLNGEADGYQDKQITVEELSSFVKNKLPELSEKYKGMPQYPVSFGYGLDFPIFIIK